MSVSQTVCSWIWIGLFVVISIVRKVHERRAGKRSSLAGTPIGEAALMVAWGVAVGVVPLFYVFSDALAMLDFPFEMPVAWRVVGVVLFLAAIWLLHRSHADLGRLWSPTVEPEREQPLITDGVFASVRHPMYSAHLLWGGAQVLLLPNVAASIVPLVLMVVLVAVRVPREERALVAEFGEAYEAYRRRTGALIPRWPFATSGDRP